MRRKLSLVNVEALDRDGKESIAQRDEEVRRLDGYRADYFAQFHSAAKLALYSGGTSRSVRTGVE